MLLQNKQSDGLQLSADRPVDLAQLSAQEVGAIRSLRREYSITSQEEDWILSGLSAGAGSAKKGVFSAGSIASVNG